MLIASDRGGGNFQLPPEGVHPARCIQVKIPLEGSFWNPTP